MFTLPIAKARDFRIVVLEIESGKIKAILLDKNDPKNSLPLYQTSVSLPILFYDNEARHEQEILNQVKKISQKIKKDTGITPEEVHCLLPTHLIEIENKIINSPYSLKKDNTEFSRELADKNTKKYLSNQKNKKLVDDIILSTDKKDNNFKIHHLITTAESSFIAKLTRNIAETLSPPSKINLHSRPLAYFSTLNKIGKTKEPLVILDPGGETTDLLVIKDGKLHQLGWLPGGKNTLTRRISESNNSSPYQTYSELELLQNNNLHDKQAQLLKNLTDDFIREWLFEIKEVIGEMKDRELAILIDDDFSYYLSTTINNWSDEPNIINIDRDWLGIDTISHKHLDTEIASIFARSYL